MKYISFREYSMRCDERKIRVREDCVCCGKVLLMCKRYGGQCMSSKCLKDRLFKNKN